MHNDCLRSTFSNLTKKSEIKQKPSVLRVTHGIGKFGSVMMEAKKYDEEEQQQKGSLTALNSLKAGYSTSYATTPSNKNIRQKKVEEKPLSEQPIPLKMP